MLGQEILDISQPQKGFFVYEITPVSFKDLLAGVENTSFMWDNRDILWVSMLVSERMVRNGWSERVPRGEGSERVCKVVLPSASFPKSYQKHIWKKCEMRNGNCPQSLYYSLLSVSVTLTQKVEPLQDQEKNLLMCPLIIALSISGFNGLYSPTALRTNLGFAVEACYVEVQHDPIKVE